MPTHKFPRSIIRISVGILFFLAGNFLIMNYIAGFFILLTESFLFCTIGVFLLTVSLYLLILPIKKIQFLYFGVILTIFGAIELISGFQTLMQDISFIEFFQIGETLIGGIFFVIGMIFLGCLILPYIIIGLSYLMKPLLGFMRSVMTRNVLRNARRTQNTFAMISIGLAFLILISTFISSLDAGIHPGAKLRLGGDIQVGWYSGYAPITYTTELQSVEHVTALTPILFLRDYWNTYLDQYTSDYFIYYYIINTTEYAKIHAPPTFMDIMAPSITSVHDFIHLLDQENCTIISYELEDKLNKTVGMFVNATSSWFTDVPLQIVGFFGMMPGIPYTYEEYTPPRYTAMMSWETFFKISGYNFTSFPSDVYFLAGLDDLSNDNIVIVQFTGILEEYRSVGPYDIISARGEVEEYSGIFNTIDVIMNQVLFIALLVSLLGLSITMNISIHQRKTEIGILRAIGISKGQVLRVIFGETLTISLAGILFGSITGIFAGFMMTHYFPFISYVPLIFTVPWMTFVIYWSILLVVALGSSVIPAYKVSKIEIVEAIRTRGV